MVTILTIIAVVIDFSQKLVRLEDSGGNPMDALINFYPYWAIWLVNTFLPVAVFISAIYFTSRLTMQTEIVAALSGGISFHRIAVPYLIVAAGISLGALLTNNFILPWSNIQKNEFQYQYMLSGGKKDKYYADKRISAQISPNEYIFADRYNRVKKEGHSFTYQVFDSVLLKKQITADFFEWKDEDSVYFLRNVYTRKTMPDFTDSLSFAQSMEIRLSATPDEILPEGYVAETMNSFELRKFIEKQKFKGSSSINNYLNELYQRISLPFSTFILTMLALSISSKKRRGGIGLNLAAGIFLAFIYIFFNQASKIYSEQGLLSPLVAVWTPNIIFGVLTVFLYFRRANS